MAWPMADGLLKRCCTGNLLGSAAAAAAAAAVAAVDVGVVSDADADGAKALDRSVAFSASDSVSEATCSRHCRSISAAAAPSAASSQIT